MKSNFVQSFILAAMVVWMSACGGETKKTTETAAPAVAETSKEDDVLKKGETVYKTYCMACHMNEGEGIANLNPPLQRTKYTLGDKKTMIDIVLNGLSGEIVVLDKTYNSAMTPFNFLSDEEVAAVLTYVRSSFGNDADAVSVEEVAQVRGAQ